MDRYFTGTVAARRAGLDVLAAEVAARHALRLSGPTDGAAHRDLRVGGEYQWRRDGEYHLFNPETVFKLQHSTRTKRYDMFKEYTRAVDEQSQRLATLRGLFELQGSECPRADRGGRAGREIVRRFSTGAMSYGSISPKPTRPSPSP